MLAPSTQDVLIPARQCREELLKGSKDLTFVIWEDVDSEEYKDQQGIVDEHHKTDSRTHSSGFTLDKPKLRR